MSTRLDKASRVLSRRRAMGIAGGSAAFVAVGSAAPSSHADAELISLCHEGVAAVTEADRLTAPFAASLGDWPPEVARTYDALFARNAEIRRLVAPMRARTINGLRAKAALERALVVEEHGDGDVAWSIIRDLTDVALS